MMMCKDTARLNLASMLSEAENLVAAGDLEAAARIYEHVMSFSPDEPQLHHVLGLVYLEQGRTNAAISHIDRSTHLNPSNADSYRSLGDAYKAAAKPDAAIRAYEKALSLSPADVDVWINLGTAFNDFGSVDRAMTAFQEALRINPENPRVLNNIGKLYQDMVQPDRALAYYDKSISIKPDYAEARFNRAVTLLTLGDFARGWPEYEWRFKRGNARNVYPHNLGTSRWKGETYAGRRLLVHCEQGMGDVLQFARFLPMVKNLGGTLILEVQAPLLPLFETMECIDHLVPFSATTAPSISHDIHIPLLSLPAVFQTTADTIPSTIPYLQPDPRKINSWRKPPAGSKVRVGLVWSSSALNPKRNIDLDRCAPWFQIPGFDFFSLQKGPAEAQLSSFKTPPPVMPLGPRLNNFGDTAAAMANLDLIISVDTAVAHLAGAMGKPLWVLLPHDADWRWPHHVTRNPWYPTARLFRQDRSVGWDIVLSDINTALENYPRESNGRASVWTDPKNQSFSPHRLSDHCDHRPNVDPSQRPIKPNSHTVKKNIKRVLLVSPLVGGSLEVIRYLHTGFLQAGLTSRLLDNSSLYQFYQELDQEVADDKNRSLLQNQLLHTLDSRVIACASEFKPDLVLAVAQSPINNATVAKLRSAGITCAYWFVEDYRFKTYWPSKVPAFDFFFTIQRDDYLRSQFASLGYTNWHYLPLACEPTIHKPWNGDHVENRSYRCQLGFMGSPYRNRMSVFDKLTHYQLGVWGQGWDAYELSPALQASVREGKRRITPEESVKIYSSADIVLNLHSSPFMDGINPDGDFVNPRTFEIAACGGFQLIDNRKELAELFDPQNEIAVFNTFEELQMMINYWLARPQLRREMSLKAQMRAYRNHTYKHRAETIIEIVENGPI